MTGAIQPYLHESRHRHALRRPRGPGGRFLTAAELRESEATQQSGLASAESINNNASTGLDGDPDSLLSPSSSTNTVFGNRGGPDEEALLPEHHGAGSLSYPSDPFLLDDLYSDAANASHANGFLGGSDGTALGNEVFDE